MASLPLSAVMCLRCALGNVCQSLATGFMDTFTTEDEEMSATVSASTTTTTLATIVDQRGCLCPTKSTALSATDVRKKIKKLKNKLQCEVCSRAGSGSSPGSPPAPGESDGVLWICPASTCTALLCSLHQTAHASAPRSGDAHAFYYNLNEQFLWCSKCRMMVLTTDEAGNSGKNQPKQFCDQVKSFQKQETEKSTSPLAKQAMDMSIDQSSTLVPPTAGSPEYDLSPGSADTAISKSPVRRFHTSSPLAGTIPHDKEHKVRPACGLSNLGNTCFYNSVMQCIMHTHLLYDWQESVTERTELHIHGGEITFNEKSFTVDSATIKLGDASQPLIHALQKFIVDFRCGKGCNPTTLFSQISVKAPRFRGWAQQDAHELLRYLLDGIRTEENKRYSDAIREHLGFSLSDERNVEKRMVIKANMLAADECYVDSIFGGSLVQIIRCSSCHHISNSLEPFLDLSLPLNGDEIETSRPLQHNNRCEVTTPSKSQAAKAANAKKKAANKLRKRKAKNAKVVEVDSATIVLSEDGSSAAAAVPNAVTNGDSAEASRTTTTDSMEVDESGEDSNFSSDGSSSFDEDDTGAASENEAISDDEHYESPSEINGHSYTPSGQPNYGEVLAAVPNNGRYGKRSVIDALRQFTAEEALFDSNAYECENCCAKENKHKSSGKKKLVEATKRYVIYSPPCILTIHLKRFEQIHMPTMSFMNRARTKKIRGYVAFDFELDIAQFCSRYGQRVNPHQKQVIYSLYGVVVHSGDLGGGHYVAYVKSRRRMPHLARFMQAAATRTELIAKMEDLQPRLDAASQFVVDVDPKEAMRKQDEDAQWYYCSDSSVRAVSRDEVSRVEAYILFYERVL